jgi:hypothetical protein
VLREIPLGPLDEIDGIDSRVIEQSDPDSFLTVPRRFLT